MPNFNYKNINDILLSKEPIRGLRTSTSSLTRTVVPKFNNLILNSANSADSIESVEIHVFNPLGGYITSLYDLQSWKIDVGTDNKVRQIHLDVHRDIFDLKLQSSTYRIVYNFFRNFIGGAFSSKMFISDISSDRKELKVSLSDPENPIALEQLRTFVLDYLTPKTYLPPIVLNFGENQIVDVINVTSDGSRTSFFVKLFDPLPTDIELYYEFWVASQIIKPYIDLISVEQREVPQFVEEIAGPNFDAEVDYWITTETDYKSWTDLLSTNVQTSQEILNRYIFDSGSNVKLNLDFREFGNFVFYASAEDRVENFLYKIGLIETYNGQLDTLNSYSGSFTGSLSHGVWSSGGGTGSYSASFSTNKITITNLRNKVISGFDEFEKWMYYETTASNYYTYQDDSSVTPFPKYSVTGSDYHIATKEGKYKLYKANSTEVITWYEDLLDKATDFDMRNDSALRKTIPDFIGEDDENSAYITFINMIGQHFDIMYWYTNHITKKNERIENTKDGLSQDLVYLAAKNMGWTLSHGTQAKDLWEYALGVSGSGDAIWTGKTTTNRYNALTYEERTKEVWRRILNNLPYIYKTKGTARGIKALLTAYGIPKTILSIREYGGPDNADFGMIPRAEWEKHTYFLNFKGSFPTPTHQHHIRTPWEKVFNESDGWSYPDALTLRWKMEPDKYHTYGADSVQTILQKNSGSRVDFFVTATHDGTDPEKGSLRFYLGGETATTAGDWSKISAGFNHTTAIKTDGTLWAWGLNTNGQLGDNTTTTKSSPVQIGSDNNWSYVAAGDYYTIAIKTNGTLWAWGQNTYGELGQGDTVSRSSPVQIGTDTNWSVVDGGNNHVLAVKTTGTLWAWGFNGNGELGDNTTVSKSSPVQIGTLSTWTSVTAGSNHGFAIKNDNTLWGWGRGGFGELGDNTTSNSSSPIQIGTSFSKVSAGGYYTLAVKTDGTLWGWGNNNKYQLGLANTTTYSSPVQIGSGYASVSAGPDSGGLNYATSLAVKTDGTLWGWGNNVDGQVGTSINVGGEVTSPVQIGADTNWNVTADGLAHGVALKTNNTLWSWGKNNNGQVGDGTTTDSSSPIQIGSLITTTVGSYATASITDEYLYDDIPLNILIRRSSRNDSTGSNQIYDFILKTGKYGKIAVERSASIVVSGSLSGSLNRAWMSDGQLFIGSGSNSQTNNILSGSVYELRYWSNPLTTSSFDNHVLAPRSYNGNTPTSSFYDLKAQWKFWQKFDAAATSSLLSSHPNQNDYKFYSSSKVANLLGLTESSFEPLYETYNMEVPSVAGDTPFTEKARIDSGSLYTGLSHDTSAEISMFDAYSVDSNKLMVAFSPQTIINEDIYEAIGYTPIDNYFGYYDNMYLNEYPQLKRFAREYWQKYKNRNDFTAYINLISIYDFSIFEQIRQTLPARVNPILGLAIEPNVLERSKVVGLRGISAIGGTATVKDTEDISKLPTPSADINSKKMLVLVGFDEEPILEAKSVTSDLDLNFKMDGDAQQLDPEDDIDVKYTPYINNVTKVTYIESSVLRPKTMVEYKPKVMSISGSSKNVLELFNTEKNTTIDAAYKSTTAVVNPLYSCSFDDTFTTTYARKNISWFSDLAEDVGFGYGWKETNNSSGAATAVFVQTQKYASDRFYSKYNFLYTSSADAFEKNYSSYYVTKSSYLNPHNSGTPLKNRAFDGCKLSSPDINVPDFNNYGLWQPCVVRTKK